MTSDRELLEHSYKVTQGHDPELGRLEFLADYVFGFTTYDSETSELFVTKALEVCAAISEQRTREYIETPDNYRWYLLMVNMPFLAGRLDWGTSIRGAWWAHEDHTLESCGLWRGDQQVTSLNFTRDEWIGFVAALGEFGAAAG